MQRGIDFGKKIFHDINNFYHRSETVDANIRQARTAEELEAAIETKGKQQTDGDKQQLLEKHNALHLALTAKEPSIEVVKKIIQLAPNTVTMKKESQTPLITAVKHAVKDEFISKLLNENTILEPDKKGNIALHYVLEAKEGEKNDEKKDNAIRILEILLNDKVEEQICHGNNKCETPIHYALVSLKTNIQKLIRDKNESNKERIYNEIEFISVLLQKIKPICGSEEMKKGLSICEIKKPKLPLHTVMSLFDLPEIKNKKEYQKYYADIHDKLYKIIYEMNPDAKGRKDRDENYPIHILCDLPHIGERNINTMIDELYPTTKKKKDKKNKDGAFPIHLAFITPCLPVECILHLLEKDTEGLDVAAFTTKHQSKYEKYHEKIYNAFPIHLACEFLDVQNLNKVLPELLKASVDSITHSKKWSPTAIYILIKRSLEEKGDDTSNMYKGLVGKLLLTDKTFKSLAVTEWKKNKIFMDACQKHNAKSEDENIDIEIRKRLNQCLCSVDAVTGNYPLHLACQEKHSKNYRKHVLSMLELASSVAKIQNKDGELPLHVATKNVASFHVVDALLNSTSSKEHKAMKRDNDRKYPDVSIYFLHSSFPKEFVDDFHVFKESLRNSFRMELKFEKKKPKNRSKVSPADPEQKLSQAKSSGGRSYRKENDDSKHVESNSELDEAFISEMFTIYYNRHTKLFSGSYLKETCGKVGKDYASCHSRLRFLIYFKLLEETDIACQHALETASELQDDKYIDKLTELMRLAEEEKTHRSFENLGKSGKNVRDISSSCLYDKASDLSLHTFVRGESDNINRQILHDAELFCFNDIGEGSTESYMAVEEIIKIDINSKILFVSPLMHAVRMGNVEIVRILINDGNGASSVKPAMFFPYKATTKQKIFQCCKDDKHHGISPYDVALYYLDAELSQNREQKDQDYEEIDMENEDMRWAVEGWKEILNEMQKSNGYERHRLKQELHNTSKYYKLLSCSLLFLFLFLMGMVSLDNLPSPAQSYATFDFTVDSYEHLVNEEMDDNLPLNYHDITTEAEFWNWINGPLTSFLFPTYKGNDHRFNCTCKHQCHETIGNSFVVGAILFRQVRKERKPCKHWPKLFGDQKYAPECVTKSFRKEDFDNACNSKCKLRKEKIKTNRKSNISSNNGKAVFPPWKITKDNGYKLYDYQSYNLPEELRNVDYSNKLNVSLTSKEQFKADVNILIENNWICTKCGTALVSVIINVYNPHINRYIVMLHSVEFKVSGAATPYIESMVLNGHLSPFATSEFPSIGFYFFVVISIFFAIKFKIEIQDYRATRVVPPYTVCGFKRKLSIRCCDFNKHWNKFWKYIFSFWNFVEFVHIYFFMRYVLSIIGAGVSGAKVKEEYIENQDNCNSDTPLSSFVPLAEYGRWITAAQTHLAFLFLLHSFHMLKILSELEIWGIGPNVLAIIKTIASRSMVPFYLVLVILILGLALSSHVAFGNQIESHHTAFKAAINVFKLTFGDFDISFDAMQESNESFAISFWVFSSLLMTMVMMNVMIAVVSDVYQESVRESRRDFTEQSNIRLMKHLKSLNINSKIVGPKTKNILECIGHYLSVSKSPRDKDVRRLVLTLAKGHGKSLQESREETFRRVLGVSKVMQYLEKLTDHAGIQLDEGYSEKDKVANSQAYSHMVEYEHQKSRGKFQKKIDIQKKSSAERTQSRVVERQNLN